MTPKIAIVTGGGTRIGKGIALHLAKQGWQVVIHYNKSVVEAKKLRVSINAISKSMVLKLDFAKLSGFDKFFHKIVSELGVPALLINNAAVFERDDVTSVSSQSLEEHMHVNCFAPILLAQKFIEVNTFTKCHPGESPIVSGENCVNPITMPICNVIPAKAGIQDLLAYGHQESLDSRLRGNDKGSVDFSRVLVGESRHDKRVGYDAYIINILDSSINFDSSRSFLSYSLSKSCLSQATKLLSVQAPSNIRIDSISPSFVMPSTGKGKNYPNTKQATSIAQICEALDLILSSK